MKLNIHMYSTQLLAQLRASREHWAEVALTAKQSGQDEVFEFALMQWGRLDLEAAKMAVVLGELAIDNSWQN